MNLEKLEIEMNEILGGFEGTVESLEGLKVLVKKHNPRDLESEAVLESSIQMIYLIVNQVRKDFEILRKRIEQE